MVLVTRSAGLARGRLSLRPRSRKSSSASPRSVYTNPAPSCVLSNTPPRPAQIMDHVIDESTQAFAGTLRAHTFFIFHDGLSAWWEADAQAHMAARGFANRQIRNTTANKGTRYENNIVGDSPEMPCPRFARLADLKAGIIKYASFTSLYPADDPRRFHLGTPQQLLLSIIRTMARDPN